MKYFKWFFGLTLMALFMSTGCEDDIFGHDGDCIYENGNVSRERIFIDEFRGIDVAIDAQVYLTYGDEFEVEVKAAENIIDNIERRVFGDTWVIEYDRCVRRDGRVEIYITMPRLDDVRILGSADVMSTNFFEGNKLDLEIDGSGDLDIGWNGNFVDAEIFGSGDILLEGSAERLDLKIAGSGDVHAFDFQTEIVDVDIIGSGDVEVRVNDLLKVYISGSGDVFYKGDPEVDVTITGSGSVIRV